VRHFGVRALRTHFTLSTSKDPDRYQLLRAELAGELPPEVIRCLARARKSLSLACSKQPG